MPRRPTRKRTRIRHDAGYPTAITPAMQTEVNKALATIEDQAKAGTLPPLNPDARKDFEELLTRLVRTCLFLANRQASERGRWTYPQNVTGDMMKQVSATVSLVENRHYTLPVGPGAIREGFKSHLVNLVETCLWIARDERK